MAADRPPRRPSLSRLLPPAGGAGALLLAGALVVGIVLSGLLASHRSGGAPAQASATPAPAPPATAAPAPATPSPPAFAAAPPPAGGRYVWYRRGELQVPGVQRLDAVDWSGRHAGTAVLRASGLPIQSPDGEEFLDPGVSPPAVLAMDGSPLGDVGPAGSVMWADDSRHLCTLTTSAGPGDGPAPVDLAYGAPGGIRRAVRFSGPRSGDSGWSLAACSASADRAVVLLGVGIMATEARVIRLSTGATLADLHEADSGALSGGVTSHDGRWQYQDRVDGLARLRDLTTGATAGRATGTGAAFSWDATETLIEAQSGNANSGAALLRRDGTKVWADTSIRAVAGYVATEPRTGGGFAIFTPHQPAATDPTYDLVIVGAAGVAQRVVGGVEPCTAA